MADAVQLDEQFYILAEGERAATPLRVLKRGDSFAVFGPHGDIVQAESAEQGFYHLGTRFLSVLELQLGRGRPLLLSSTINRDNLVFIADLTNPDITRDGVIVFPRGEIHLLRSRALWDGGFTDRLRVTNHSHRAIDVPVAFHCDADFVDVFEVRGTGRPRRGERLPDVAGQQYVLGYRGLDGVERRIALQWDRRPDKVGEGVVSFVLKLGHHESTELELSATCAIDSAPRPALRYADVVAAGAKEAAQAREQLCVVSSSNESFNRWMSRSAADLRMMITETAYGPYPYAGIPWFSTPFGRDGIITALELLWAVPDIARGVLTFLAATQATSVSEREDAQPGKILHEMRYGEMAALGEVPFGKYYGSADATPLFVVLAHAYYERTGDLGLIDRIWPHVIAALDWMAGSGDPDRDGFIEYARLGDTGLVQQGWKDSYDSIHHADGTLATGPIAVCEVQGYAYAAWRGAAALAAVRGDPTTAERWAARAERLRADFESAFWCEELGTYALALDGRKQMCRVRTSNAGHCLFTGIASQARAERVAASLMSEAAFAGWGVRTVAAGEARYNPMSYHNGSIWPHDNALIAAGLSRYGLREPVLRILSGLLDLSAVVDLHRLPELVCGFHRRDGGEFPTLYPVACAPQAWAAGAVFLLLEACLGLRVDAHARRVSFQRAALPEAIDWIRLTNVAVADARVDILLTRHPYDVGVTVARRQGVVEIVAVK
jgi:glycogen debranching enzyme